MTKQEKQAVYACEVARARVRALEEAVAEAKKERNKARQDLVRAEWALLVLSGDTGGMSENCHGCGGEMRFNSGGVRHCVRCLSTGRQRNA